MDAVLTQGFKTAKDIRTYRHNGGYQSLIAAFDFKPKRIIAEVEAANLRGRGGAGFPCGVKWRLRGEDAAHPRYLICNIDESEPGTFKDRQLLFGGPHQIIEAIIVSAYALQVQQAFVFIRAEYAQGARILEKAIAQARAAGLLGRNISGSGFDLELSVHLSAGRYICGEETALINALEGKRPNPRHKPPRPSVKGLWAKPTTINNVETLVNVPHILLKGADWFRNLGINGGHGPKLYGISGRVVSPRLVEAAMGSTARELIFNVAGGLIAGHSLVGFLPGGSSTAFLTAQHLDVAMDFDPVKAAGSRLGTGGIIVVDDGVCLVRVALNLMRFFARESCGFCTPCRDGLPYLVDILTRIEQGQGLRQDLELMDELCETLAPQAFCAFADGAVTPLQSSLQLFRDHYEQHIEAKACPLQKGRPH